MKIGELLLKEGLINQQALDKALQEQKQGGYRVGYNLVKLGFVNEMELTRMLARQYRDAGGGPAEVRGRSQRSRS